jgi:sugar transferase (PEP-CTERM/EpsH1 system associated)
MSEAGVRMDVIVYPDTSVTMPCATHAGDAQLPLIAHIIHRLAVGGLETGLVNLINNMPPAQYRHAIVCLTDYTDFREHIRDKHIPIVALHKKEGHDLGVYVRLWRALRHLRPAIVHTRNLSGLEYLMLAAMARIPGRVHGEHGRDIYDLDGTSIKYNLLRRAIKPFVRHYIAVSVDLGAWLVHTVGVDSGRMTQIYNGVDVQRFTPRVGPRPPLGPEGFASQATLVMGTVGRMHAVKDQLTLVRAFLHILATVPQAREWLRLVLIGDGPLLQEASQLLRMAGAESLAWLPGERHDSPDIMRALDVFVLPSLREGISNTILEAMATGLPVVATRVGGNPELVEEGHTGQLVPPSDPVAMAEAIGIYGRDRGLAMCHGRAGRQRVENQFSMAAMVNSYLAVYDAVLQGTRFHHTAVVA